MKEKVLFTNGKIEVRERDGWFVYAHTSFNGGIGVAVLAYKTIKGKRWYLGRHEVTPSHSDKPMLCALTGGYEKKMTLVECALKELYEEGGFRAPLTAASNLGIVRPSKASDTIMHLYAVDLDSTGVEELKSVSEGKVGRYGSYVKWVTEEDLIYADDPLNHAMILRLKYAHRNS